MKFEQDVATMAGKYACLALCYLKLYMLKTGTDANYSALQLLISHYDELIKQGAITNTFFVQDPAKLIKVVFNANVEITKSAFNDTGEFQIMNNGQHFVIGDDVGEIVWNSMDNDAAWKKIGLKDWRIMRIK